MTLSSIAASFEPFARLPIELRLKIWSFALISYPAQTFRLKTCGVRKPRKHLVITIRATAPPSALAHANQEARLEALEHFSQTPTTIVSTAISAQNYPPDYKCALVNFSVDVFTVESLHDIPFFPTESIRQIQLLRATVRDILFFGEDLRNSGLIRLNDLREIEFTVPVLTLDYFEAGLERMVSYINRAREEEPNWIFPKVKILEDGVVLKVHGGGAWTGE